MITKKIEKWKEMRGFKTIEQVAIREGVIDILEELQKLQEGKVCKWRMVDTGKGYKNYRDCKNVQWAFPSDFCDKCGGKVEIIKTDN